MSAPAVEFRDVSKRYGLVVAVDNISFAIALGSLVTLLGPSGCGKTSTLRLIAGLEQASSGRILIGGTDVTKLSAAERDVSMVFQSYALFPHMTVLENVCYGLRAGGTARARARELAAAKLALVGLAGYESRLPSELSGGQQQRVAVARAIVLEPQVLLFDEPLSNLDAKLRLTMRAEIRRLQRRLGVTSLFVTHDQVEAMTLGDRLLVMHLGRPAQLATPMEVFARPADTYVAGFIGAPTMNFLPAQLARGGTAVQLDAGLLLPFADGRRPGTDGDSIVIGIRPEHLVAGAGLELAIDLIEPLGSETLVHGHLSRVEDQSLTVKLVGPAPAGDRLVVMPQSEHLHVFDHASGRRIDPIGEETVSPPLAALGTAD